MRVRGNNWLIIVSVLFCIISCMCYIYPDRYSLLFFVIIFAWPCCLIFSIWQIIKNKLSFKRFFPLLIFILCLIFCESGLLDKFYCASVKSLRYEVIEMISQKDIEVNKTNIIELKGKYKWITSDGTIIIFSNIPKEEVVGFWKIRGMLDSGFCIYVYVRNNKKETLEEIMEKEFPYVNYTGYSIEQLENYWFKVVVNSL